MLNASQETLHKLGINWSPPLRNQGLLEGGEKSSLAGYSSQGTCEFPRMTNSGNIH